MKMYIIDKKIPNAHSIFFSLVLPVGSIYEDTMKAGITHLIEHLCFRRTKNLDQMELYRFCEQRGTMINAVTGKDFLWFYFSVRSDVFEDIIVIFHQMFYELEYTIKDLETEKKIIVGEAEGFEQTNDSIIIDSLWSNVAFSNSILGSIESLNNISLSDVLEYKKRLLSLSGTVFLCGNFTDEQKKLTQDLFYNCHSECFSADALFCEKSKTESGNIQFVKDKYKLCDVYYAFKISLNDAERTKEIICLQMLESVLFQGNTAYITSSLREEFGIYNIDSRLECLGNEAVFLFNFKADNGCICTVIEKLELLLQKFVFDTQYYDYIKSFFCDNIGMLYDNLEDYSTNWIDNYILFGEPMTPERKAEKIAGISLEFFNEVYRAMLKTRKSWFFGKLTFKQRKKLFNLLSRLFH